MTLMWTTVSTSASAITLAMTGLRMSARTNVDVAEVAARRDDVDADDPVDGRVGREQRARTGRRGLGRPR